MSSFFVDVVGNGQLVINAGYALAALTVFIVAKALLQEQETRAAAENLDDLRNRKASNALVKFTRPFFTQYVVPVIRGKPFWDEKRKYFKRRIIAAGLKEELTADEFIAFKVFLIGFFPIVGGLMNALDLIEVSGLTILGSSIAGWFYPNIWVNGRAAARQKQVLKSMPFIVDLLALSTEAGLDFVGAIGKVVEKATPSPLVEEFSQVLKEIKVGSSRAEALREMAIRIDLTQINSFVSVLISSDQMGASIGKILRQQADQIRVERMLRAEKAGAAAAQKVLLPLVLFIVPAVMLMVFGPFALGFIYGNG